MMSVADSKRWAILSNLCILSALLKSGEWLGQGVLSFLSSTPDTRLDVLTAAFALWFFIYELMWLIRVQEGSRYYLAQFLVDAFDLAVVALAVAILSGKTGFGKADQPMTLFEARMLLMAITAICISAMLALENQRRFYLAILGVLVAGGFNILDWSPGIALGILYLLLAIYCWSVLAASAAQTAAEALERTGLSYRKVLSSMFTWKSLKAAIGPPST